MPLVRLSLLTMTNPNQLCDMLLFVCSKMALTELLMPMVKVELYNLDLLNLENLSYDIV